MGYGYFPFIQPSGVNPLIYDADGHLILQLNYIAGVSEIKGQVATGTDLKLSANSTDAYPDFRLHGAGEVEAYHAAGSYTAIFDAAVRALKVTYAANVTTVEGGGVTGDVLILKANSTNARPFIHMTGGGNFSLNSTSAVIFNFAGVDTGYLGGDADNINIVTYTNNNIGLLPNGTGKVKFGTYTAGAATDSTGYITILDAGGTVRKLMVQA